MPYRRLLHYQLVYSNDQHILSMRAIIDKIQAIALFIFARIITIYGLS